MKKSKKRKLKDKIGRKTRQINEKKEQNKENTEIHEKKVKKEAKRQNRKDNKTNKWKKENNNEKETINVIKIVEWERKADTMFRGRDKNVEVYTVLRRWISKIVMKRKQWKYQISLRLMEQ